MTCPICGYAPLTTDGTCPNCKTKTPESFPGSEETLNTIGDTTATDGSPSGSSADFEFSTQAIVGNRYRILQHLGRGGMGSVYKAHDMELNRVVALKTIRGDLSRHSWALDRMKKEVVLARQVTHKNVSRVFDLGQHDRVRFLTMEFIEGRNLGERLRDGERFSIEKAGEIMLQCAEGLRSAHEAGVVHRDLKPDNVMLGEGGKVTLMDFGIAKLTGEMAQASYSGTPRYVSPEQVTGLTQDQRSDIYSMGLIFYELIAGEHPFPNANSLEAIRKRAEAEAPHLHKQHPGVPQKLSDIVSRCLSLRAEDRYTAEELVAAISNWLHPTPIYQRRSVMVSLAVALLLSVGGIVWTINRKPPKPRDPVSVLIADFQNTTNEQVLNGTLEPVMQVALEGASFITTYDRGTARRLIAQLRPSAPVLDMEGARLVALREGIQAIVSGSVSRTDAKHYTIVLRAIGADGKELMKEQRASAGPDEILVGLSKLTIPVRQALGDKTPKNEQIKEAETYTAASLESSHQYALAQEYQLRGRYDDAAKAYAETIRLDPSMGRAYAGLAVLNRNSNHPVEAIKNYELALARLDRMSDREKLRTRGGYYVTSNDNEKAVEEFKALVAKFPADTAGHANLALALLMLRKTDEALQEGRKAIEIYPKNLAQRNNVALYALYAGNFETTLREASEVLKENPKYEKSYVATALAALLQNHPDMAMDSYQKLSTVSDRGASMAAVGLADMASYQGRLDDAIQILKRGIASDESRKNVESAARKYADLALVYVKLKNNSDAVSAADRALGSTTDSGTVLEAAFASIDAGSVAKVEAIAAKLRQKIGPENQVAASLIEGYVELGTAPVQAIETLRKAQMILNTWLGHYLLGRAYLAADAYAEAHSEFEACINRQGEASAVFLDDVPTARLLPTVFYYLAQSEANLNVGTAAESYQRFLSVQTATRDQDPLVVSAKTSLRNLRPAK